jgi:hypothetical protein
LEGGLGGRVGVHHVDDYDAGSGKEPRGDGDAQRLRGALGERAAHHRVADPDRTGGGEVHAAQRDDNFAARPNFRGRHVVKTGQ